MRGPLANRGHAAPAEALSLRTEDEKKAESVEADWSVGSAQEAVTNFQEGLSLLV